jgi:hypothetical protein
MTSGPSYQLLYDELRLWVYPGNGDYIRDTILTNAPPGSDNLWIYCQVDWELVEYCQDELFGDTRLHQVLTITGSPKNAQASSCEDYVTQTWGYCGKQLLDAIITGLNSGRLGERS